MTREVTSLSSRASDPPTLFKFPVSTGAMCPNVKKMFNVSLNYLCSISVSINRIYICFRLPLCVLSFILCRTSSSTSRGPRLKELTAREEFLSSSGLSTLASYQTSRLET